MFRSNGGNDTILGTLRPEDVIKLAPGASAADYQTTTDANGVTTDDQRRSFVDVHWLPLASAPQRRRRHNRR